MRFYWSFQPEMNIPFGQPIEQNYLLPEDQKPYLCVYLVSELNDYVASKHNARVGFLMAERYIRIQVQPFLHFRGEVLGSKEYP
jgi:hypothetical protein